MPIDMESLIETLKKIKDMYENAVREGRYTRLIRSRKLIEMLHKFAIIELKKRFPSHWIFTDKPNSPERDDLSSDDFIDEILRYIIKIKKFRGLIKYLKKKYRYIVLENKYEKVIIFVSKTY